MAPLLALVFLLLTGWAVRRLSTQTERESADAAVWWAAAAGLVAARLVQVGLYWDDCAPQPMSMLDIRDGGFVPPAGAMAGLGALGWRMHGRVVQSRRPVMVTAVVGVVLWALAAQTLSWWRPAPGQTLADIGVILRPLLDPDPNRAQGATDGAAMAATGGATGRRAGQGALEFLATI